MQFIMFIPALTPGHTLVLLSQVFYAFYVLAFAVSMCCCHSFHAVCHKTSRFVWNKSKLNKPNTWVKSFRQKLPV